MRIDLRGSGQVDRIGFGARQKVVPLQGADQLKTTIIMNRSYIRLGAVIYGTTQRGDE
jgi:hypothetical protein